MWWKRKKEEPKPDWTQEGIDKLLAFRKRGETFRYLGVTMMVTGHWEIWPNLYGFHIHPSLRCDYVDVHGVLHNASFSPDELPTLERENSNANASRQPRRDSGVGLDAVVGNPNGGDA